MIDLSCKINMQAVAKATAVFTATASSIQHPASSNNTKKHISTSVLGSIEGKSETVSGPFPLRKKGGEKWDG
jgi:hypothetical protein